MSEVKVNKISPRSGTTVTLGDSGDTITLASGVSLTGVNATFSGNTTIGGNLTVDTNTFFIDSVNNIVRVGDNSSYTPNASADDLIVGNTTSGSKTGITILSSNDVAYSRGDIYFADSASDSVGRIEYNHGTSDTDVMKFYTNSTERMRIDSSGNVGIGTSSPSSYNSLADNLVVGTTSGDNGITIATGTANGGRIIFSDNTTSPFRGAFEYDHSTDGMITYTNGTERMRIDSSGNVLVGKTAIALATVGGELRADGQITGTRSGGSPLILNRTTSDGEIAQFYKDATKVGSIGTRSSNLSIGSVDTGLEFNQANDIIFPANPSTNNTRDNAIDLGSGEARFKNLYLSGGVRLGGTGASHDLNDYEEGTWTPRFNRDVSLASVAYSRQTGVYTKIGHTVIAWFDLIVTSYSGGGGDYGLHGLPYTSNLGSTNGGYSIPVIRAATLMPTDFKIYGNSSYHNTNTDYFYFRHYNSSGTEVASSPNSSGRVSGFTIYTTSS